MSSATVVPIILGAMLGFGVLLVFQGIGFMRRAAGDEAVRRKGFWRLNFGLLLIGVSMIAFARTGVA